MSSLPKNRSERIMELVKRSAPKKRDNRLPDKYEKLYQKTDTELAACYASIDDLGDRFDELIDAISEETSEGIVMDEIDEFAEISTVHHINEARQSIDMMHVMIPPPPRLPPPPSAGENDDKPSK